MTTHGFTSARPIIDFRSLLSFLPSPAGAVPDGITIATRSVTGLKSSVVELGQLVLSSVVDLVAEIVGCSHPFVGGDGVPGEVSGFTMSLSSSCASTSSSSRKSSPSRLSMPFCLTLFKLGPEKAIGGASTTKSLASSISGSLVGEVIGERGNGMACGSTSRGRAGSGSGRCACVGTAAGAEAGGGAKPACGDVSSLGSIGLGSGSVDRDRVDGAVLTAWPVSVSDGGADRPVSLRINEENDEPER